MSQLVGVIPAAGHGTRAYPHTRVIPKAMLDICGQPVLHYTLEIMRDRLGIRDMVVILGRHGEAIRRHFGTGEKYGVAIRYVQNDRVELGLSYSVLLAREHVPGSHFVVMLSDELYWNSNHASFPDCGYQKFAATLAVRANSANREICKNFSVDLKGDAVQRIIEKPKFSQNGLLGCGTYVFRRDFFDVLERRFASSDPGAGDLTSAIGQMISAGQPVQRFALKGDYININYEEDVHYARSLVRRSRLARARISMVLPCEGPAPIVEDMLRLARGHERVNEVLLVVCEQNAGISELAGRYGAKVVLASGANHLAYGRLFRAGIAETSGEIVVLTKDDDSFDLADLDKLLAYMCEADLVLGTRTTSQLVQQGSNLKWVPRVANFVLAKLIELLWLRRRVRLTDVGCTFRAFWRETYDQLEPDLRSDGPEFSPEMIVEVLRRHLWVIEVPINYCRTGEEAKVRKQHRNVAVFFSMAAMIISRRFRAPAA
ncbi:MAG: sugar phosphate nucleotidyltransferase [Acidobacteriota bacterium]